MKPKNLLGLRDHEIHGSLYGVVLERGVAALGRHEALLALEALEGVLVEFVLALGDARAPVGLVTELRRAGDTGGVAYRTGGIVGGLAVRARGVGRRDQRVHHRVAGGGDDGQLADRRSSLPAR